MRSVGAAVLVTWRVVLMLEHGHASASGFSDVQRRPVAAEHLDGRPFRQHRERRRRVRTEFLPCMDDFSAYDGEHGFDAFDVLVRNGEVVIRKDVEVSELAWRKAAFFAALTRKPTAALRVKPQGFFATEAIPVGIQRDAADCLSGDQPIEGNPRVITGDSCGVCSCAHGDSEFEHFANWRRSLSGLFAIAANKVLALVSHPMLNGDSAAQCSNAFEITV